MSAEDPESVSSVSCRQQDLHLSSGEDTNDSDAEQETFKDEEAALPDDLEWIEELYEEDSSDDDLALAADKGKKWSCAETARMFKLRRNLDQLDCSHRQQEHDVQKAREKLKLCRQNIESLLEERNNLEREIEQQKLRNDSVAVFSLRFQHKNLCQKLQNEEELEGHINTELRQQELELNEMEVELGKVSVLRQEVQEEEQLFRVLKAQKAAARLQQERKVSQNLEQKQRLLKQKQTAMLKKEESDCQRKTEENRASRKTAAKYWKQTIKRMHQQAAEKEQENRELVEKRIQAVNSLKSNIAANQESLRSQQSRAKANAQKQELQQRQLRESLQAQGINSIRHVLQQKQLEETKRKQKEFEESQKSKREEIVAKILQEEQLMKNRTRTQTSLKSSSTDKFPILSREREKLLYHLDPITPAANLQQVSDISRSLSASSDLENLEGMEEIIQEDMAQQSLADSLAEPEFSGLWDQDYKKLICYTEKSTPVQKEVKEDQPSMSGRKIITSPKKVCGKELRGPSFVSKPEVILFKDFEVGKMYKKKIILTNISYTINHCKLLRVSPQLKDFISVNFEPPGPLSTGMSCDIQTVFQPLINEDLEGEIQFVSALGPFSVPVRCTTKKCNLEVDSQFIDFGSHIVGQAVSQTITLTNKGALATLFSLDTSTCFSPESSHVQIPYQISANTYQDTCSDKTTSNNQKSSASMDAGEVRTKQQSQELSEPSQQEQSATDPETFPETCLCSGVDTRMEQITPDSSDIRIGSVKEGEIGPFESIKLEVVFTPTIPGENKMDFHIKFSDMNTKPIPIQVRGTAVTMPVWVVQPSIDQQICMFDFIYQDSIMVQSRATTTLKLTFEVCPEMRKHLKIVPKTGFIQAQSSFNAQLKFMPRSSLPEDAEKFFDRHTGVLEVPMTVQVAGQVQPAHFTVQAVVTSSDLQFDQTEVDFGFCSIYMSVRSRVRLTNLSFLPQDFGFIGVPEFIKIQPNDGFGTLLPQETLELDLIFSPKTAKEYHFQLTCKSGINRNFLLSCRAVGVQTPVELSHSLVQFRATAVGDQSTAIVYLVNHHTDHKSKQALTPVVKDAVTHGTPRLFRFTLAEDSDISISPSAGRLLPGERCPVQVKFKPRLLDCEIKKEALRRHHQAKLLQDELERNKHTKQETKTEIPVEASKGKKGFMNPKNNKISEKPKADQPMKSPDPVDIQPGSEHYEEAKASLLCSFSQRCSEHTIPCFVSDGDPPETDGQVQPSWSPINTLYLKLQCPALRPPLVVISNNGNSTLDFHQVLVGMRVIKKFTVQNISEVSLDLRSSVLNINGPFSLLNALRRIRPGEKHTLVLAFSPTLEKKYIEILELQSQKMILEMTLRGEGVIPAITSSHTGGPLDFGHVLEKETTSQCVQLQNSSALAVEFRALLSSQSQSRTQGEADSIALLLDGYRSTKIRPTVGTQNYSGMSVFRVAPVEGSIAPGQSQDITITFQPDHSSVNYSDKLTIELLNKSKVCVMDLKGAASSHNMYLCGGDLLRVPIESLLPPLITSHPQLTESEVKERPVIPVLVTLKARCSAGVVTPAVRELEVGCIRSTHTSKKTGEFYWDNMASLKQQGFSVEPLKGSVEAGHKCTITITWTPHSGNKPFDVVQMCLPLTIKGDETNIYRVTLMALVSTTAD